MSEMDVNRESHVDVDPSRSGMGKIIFRVHGTAIWRGVDLGWSGEWLEASPVGYADADGEETRWTDAQVRDLHLSMPYGWTLYWDRGVEAIQNVLAELDDEAKDAQIESEARKKGVEL